MGGVLSSLFFLVSISAPFLHRECTFGACWVRTQPPSLHAARFEATFLADSVLGDTNSVPRRQKICPPETEFLSPRGQNQSSRTESVRARDTTRRQKLRTRRP